MSDKVGLNETDGTGDGTEILATDGDSDGKKLTLPITLGETDSTELGMSDVLSLGPNEGTPD